MEDNNKQSSIDHLVLRLKQIFGSSIEDLLVNEIKEAKAIHKDEMEFSFKGGMSLVEGHIWKPADKFEEFYNKKFKNDTAT